MAIVVAKRDHAAGRDDQGRRRVEAEVEWLESALLEVVEAKAAPVTDEQAALVMRDGADGDSQCAFLALLAVPRDDHELAARGDEAVIGRDKARRTGRQIVERRECSVVEK